MTSSGTVFAILAATYLRHPELRRLAVPNHQEPANGTLRALIREAGLTKEEFLHWLGKSPRRSQFLLR